MKRPRGGQIRAEEASRVVTVRMSPQEMLQVVAAANRTRKKPRVWMREALIGAAFECLEDELEGR